jgi:hypothetical protein
MYNITNSTELAHELNDQHKCLSLNIKDFYVNTPIKEIIHSTQAFQTNKNIAQNVITEYMNLLQTVLNQNSFAYKGKYYAHKKGVTKGAPHTQHNS